jgi:hypothetical protein
MPYPFVPHPNPVAATETGLADQTWINDLRDSLRDYPQGGNKDTITADGTSGVFSATAVPYYCSKKPISDNPADFNLAVGAQVYTAIFSGTPTGFQVLVNPDTGELIFPSAPAAAALISWTYKTLRWRDQTLGDKLYAGLRRMFPKVGKTYSDITIPIQVNVWDYTLPEFMADPRSKLLNVEVADPFIPTEPFRPLKNYERINLTTLHIPQSQRYSPAAQLRITVWGPYLRLGDLEPQLYYLPIWYAMGTLLASEEAKRIRSDMAVTVQQEGARPPLTQVQAAAFYINRFETELADLKGTPTVRRRLVSSYARDRHY